MQGRYGRSLSRARDRRARRSAGACCHRHHLVVGFTWIEGSSEKLPPQLRCLDLFGPAGGTLIDTQHPAAGRGLAVVQNGIGDSLGNAGLAQRGGKGPAEVVPGPADVRPSPFSRFIASVSDALMSVNVSIGRPARGDGKTNPRPPVVARRARSTSMARGCR